MGSQDLCGSCKQEYTRFVLNALLGCPWVLSDDVANKIIRLFNDKDVEVKGAKE